MLSVVDRREQGSALVEFIGAVAIVSVLFLGVAQFAWMAHLRSTCTQAAIEGSRLAARSGASEGAGNHRTAELLLSALGTQEAQITTTRRQEEQIVVVQTEVRLPVTFIGLWDWPAEIRVHGRSLAE